MLQKRGHETKFFLTALNECVMTFMHFKLEVYAGFFKKCYFLQNVLMHSKSFFS